MSFKIQTLRAIAHLKNRYNNLNGRLKSAIVGTALALYAIGPSLFTIYGVQAVIRHENQKQEEMFKSIANEEASRIFELLSSKFKYDHENAIATSLEYLYGNVVELHYKIDLLSLEIKELKSRRKKE